MHYIFSMLSIIFKLKKYVYGIKNDFKNQWSIELLCTVMVVLYEWLLLTYIKDSVFCSNKEKSFP